MKSIFKSKTFWFNALTILTAIATVGRYVPDQKLAQNTTDILFTLAPVVNIILRFYTSKHVTLLG